ncbi:MAG: hypothetical protein LBO74_09415 [Candidatus Symbiothrix sp.]|nr:hypothetical protein [Candidatus Symbiothrix sp.]
MAQVTGITIERNKQGIARYARIDIKRYGDRLKDFFYENGVEVEESTYNPEFVAKIKSQEKMPGVKIKASDIWK